MKGAYRMRNAEHVVIGHCGHLSFLNVRGMTLWIAHKASHILLSLKPMDGRTAGISSGGSQSCEKLGGIFFVSRAEQILAEVAQELHRDVFVGKSRAMEEFQQPALAVGYTRCHLFRLNQHISFHKSKWADSQYRELESWHNSFLILTSNRLQESDLGR